MKKILIPVIAVIVIIIVVLILNGNAKKNLAGSSPTPATPIPALASQMIKNGLSLAGFPTDIPVEAGATVIQSSSTTNSAGQTVATYEFISKKTIVDNFMIYKNSLPPNRWAISIMQDLVAKKIIDATKGDVQAKITISKNTSNQVVVSIQATTIK